MNASEYKHDILTISDLIKSGDLMSESYLDEFDNVEELKYQITTDEYGEDRNLRAQLDGVTAKRSWKNGSTESVISKAFFKAEKFYKKRLENLILRRDRINRAIELNSDSDPSYLSRSVELNSELKEVSQFYEQKRTVFQSCLDEHKTTRYNLIYMTKPEDVPENLALACEDLVEVCSEILRVKSKIKNRKNALDDLHEKLAIVEKNIKAFS